jgi:hypothetical protein
MSTWPGKSPAFFFEEHMDRVKEIKQLLRDYPRDEFDNLIYPENPDEEPVWVALRDELADITGRNYLRAQYRTRRAYDEAVTFCEFVAQKNMIKAGQHQSDIENQIRSGKHLSIGQYADRWNVSLGHASKRIKHFVSKGIFKLEPKGHRKVVKWADPIAKAA